MGAKQPRAKPVAQLSTGAEPDFDYTILTSETRTAVQQHACEIKSLMRRTAQDLIDIGQKLLAVKEQLGHGHFELWLRAEFNWGPWTARKFMQVARQFKSVKFTDLAIDASALYLLAAPSTHEAVRQQALERAGQGEAITHAKVKAIASGYTESAKAEAATIDISARTVGWEDFTASQLLGTQTQEAGSHIKKQLENKLLGKATAALADLPANDGSCNLTPAPHSSDDPTREQSGIERQSLFKVGHRLQIAKSEQQHHKCVGEVVEVKEVSATEMKIVIKISLPPSEAVGCNK